jgi:hypothetical protein
MSTIEGLQEAQAACLLALAAMRPDGALGRSVQFGLAAASRYAIASTPVKSGAWRGSHRVKQSGLRGELFLDPSARNPRGGRPAVYGARWETEKGGRYAVYKNTYQQQNAIAQAAATALIEELP